MQKHKFDETDRGKVISEVEQHFSTKLSRVGNYRKFLQDPSGRSYWVFGGYDDWHGITSDMLKEEQRRATDGVLVVAKRHKSTIDIFSGPLKPLIANSREPVPYADWRLSVQHFHSRQFHDYQRASRAHAQEARRPSGGRTCC